MTYFGSRSIKIPGQYEADRGRIVSLLYHGLEAVTTGAVCRDRYSQSVLVSQAVQESVPSSP